jgi:hypothetical protein
MQKILCFCAMLVISLCILHSAHAGLLVKVDLLNHGFGSEGPNYGLRVDNGSVQTFSFGPDGGAGVEMQFFSDNTAKIVGVTKHNQSGQLWSLDADLSIHLFTNDGSEWRTNLSGDLYGEMLNDLINFGANENHAGEHNLKDKNYAADRIGFEVLTLTMELQSPGPAVFTLPGQTNGVITLYDFPQSANVIPFLLAKGHRLGNSSQEIAGLGWLDPRKPSDQNGGDGLTQDFLFKLKSDSITVVPEPGSVVAIAAIALVGLIGCVRKRR